MKTIEEKAKEYGNEVSPGSSWTAKNAELNYKQGFIDAHTWIPFTEELPIHNERILVKTKHNNECHTFKFTGNSDIKASADYLSLVSWRPIDLK